jgi:hypothetical protein
VVRSADRPSTRRPSTLEAARRPNLQGRRHLYAPRPDVKPASTDPGSDGSCCACWRSRAPAEDRVFVRVAHSSLP